MYLQLLSTIEHARCCCSVHVHATLQALLLEPGGHGLVPARHALREPQRCTAGKANRQAGRQAGSSQQASQAPATQHLVDKRYYSSLTREARRDCHTDKVSRALKLCACTACTVFTLTNHVSKFEGTSVCTPDWAAHVLHLA
jgi:hypothetical protein